MNTFSCSSLKFIGRIFLAAVFLLSGIGKFLDPSPIEQFMVAKGVPYAHLLLYASAIIEIIGAVCLILGFWTKTAAIALFVWLAIVTFVIHNFWMETGAARQMDMINFLKNIAILGGLLFVASSGPGRFAICCDSHCTKDKK